MTSSFGQDERFPRTVENRIRQWREVEEVRPVRLNGGGEIDYITISREVGSGGAEVAQKLSKLMEWGLYDRKILDFMAENFGIHKDVLESVDEKTRGWIEDSLSLFFSKKSSKGIDQLSYYKHLVEALLVIAKHGRAIIVGRAASHVLPRRKGLSVLLTAPFELRCRRYAERNDINIEKATSEVKKKDKEQRKFVKSFLYKDAFDVRYYDIVFNTEKLSPEAVAKLIWRAFDQRVLEEKE